MPAGKVQGKKTFNLGAANAALRLPIVIDNEARHLRANCRSSECLLPAGSVYGTGARELELGCLAIPGWRHVTGSSSATIPKVVLACLILRGDESATHPGTPYQTRLEPWSE